MTIEQKLRNRTEASSASSSSDEAESPALEVAEPRAVSTGAPVKPRNAVFHKGLEAALAERTGLSGGALHQRVKQAGIDPEADAAWLELAVGGTKHGRAERILNVLPFGSGAPSLRGEAAEVEAAIAIEQLLLERTGASLDVVFKDCPLDVERLTEIKRVANSAAAARGVRRTTAPRDIASTLARRKQLVICR